MGEPFVENGCEAANYLAEKYWNRGFDAVTRKLGIFPNSRGPGAVTKRSGKIANPASSRTGGERVGRRQKNRLPSPEGSIESWDKERYRSQVESSQPRRESSLDRQSEFSDQVIRAYELDPRDPTRRPANVLSNRDLRNAKMSYANGNLGTGQYQQQQGQRANSAQPPRTRNYDDEEEYGSDYDDRRGNRYQTTGRGYDDRDYDDRGFDREVIETERYRGVSGALVVRPPTPRTTNLHPQGYAYLLTRTCVCTARRTIRTPPPNLAQQRPLQPKRPTNPIQPTTTPLHNRHRRLQSILPPLPRARPSQQRTRPLALAQQVLLALSLPQPQRLPRARRHPRRSRKTLRYLSPRPRGRVSRRRGRRDGWSAFRG